MRPLVPLFAAVLLAACATTPKPQPIAIELTNDRIIIPVRINGGAPRSFILDTGASSSVLNADRLAELGLTSAAAGAAQVEGGEVDAQNVRGVSLQIGDVTLPSRDTAAIALHGVEAGLGRAIYGIIGGELFARTVVTVDYSHHLIRLGDTPPPHATAIPIEIDEGTPIITARIGNVSARMQLDTGGGAVTLFGPFLAAHPELVPATTLQVTSGAVLPGKSRGGIGRLELLEVGDLRIAKPIVNFSQNMTGDRVDVDAGFIGGDVLRRFTLTTDYANRRVFLTPNASIDEPFEFAMSGASFAAEGADLRTIRVRSIIPNSPASEAGLRMGDRVINIDGRALSLDELRHALLTPNVAHELLIERDGAQQTLRITPRRLI